MLNLFSWSGFAGAPACCAQAEHEPHPHHPPGLPHLPLHCAHQGIHHQGEVNSHSIMGSIPNMKLSEEKVKPKFGSANFHKNFYKQYLQILKNVLIF